MRPTKPSPAPISMFKLEDPDGSLLGEFTLTAGAGASTVIDAGGLKMTVTDGATDFIVGDKFTMTVAAGSGKLVPFVVGGTGGAGVPKAIVDYEESCKHGWDR